MGTVKQKKASDITLHGGDVRTHVIEGNGALEAPIETTEVVTLRLVWVPPADCSYVLDRSWMRYVRCVTETLVRRCAHHKSGANARSALLCCSAPDGKPSFGP